MFGEMKKSGKNDLVAAANKQFDLSLPKLINFLEFIEADKIKLSDDDLWLLRSYQLSIILRCFSMENAYQKTGQDSNFDHLFDITMTPFVRSHPDIAGAMNFFAAQQDAPRVAEFILDIIGLNLPNHHLFYIQMFWDKPGSLVPCISKMPFVMNLYWDLFCSAGIVIEDGLGISKYKKKFDQILRNKEADLLELKHVVNTVPSSAREIYRNMRPIFLGNIDNKK